MGSKTIWAITGSLFMMVALIGIPVMAPAVSADEELIKILDITPVISGELTAEMVPSVFHGKGCIDRMEGMEIVVGDRLMKLSNEVVFHTKKGKVVTRNQFHVGDFAGYLKNKKGDILEIYKLE